MAKSTLTNLNQDNEQTQFKDYILIVTRRMPVILVSFLSLVFSTIFYVYKIEDIYESYSTIVIEEKNPFMGTVIDVRGRSLSFYQGILNSHTFLELVRDSIGMDMFINIYSKFKKDDALLYIQNNISLRKTSYMSFLRLNSRAKSRELSYLMASIATDLFQKRCREVESEESRRALVEIEKQLEIIREKLEKAEYEYRTFKEQIGNIHEGMTPELKTLHEAHAANLAQLGLKEADLKAEKAQLHKLEAIVTPAKIHKSPEVLKLRSRLKELEKERIRLENLGIRISGISTIEREIKEIERQLLHYKQSYNTKDINTTTISQWQNLRKSVITKEADLVLFKRRLESYNRAIKNYKKNNPDILNKSLELLKLKRSKEIYENIYNILLEKTEEKRILSTSSSSGIKVVDFARIPDTPIPKRESRYYILGIILGLSLGLGLAFLLEFNDTSIKTNEDIERHLKLPVLGTIPHIIHNKNKDITIQRNTRNSQKGSITTQYPSNLLNFEGDESIITEAYRSLRTNLSFVSPDNPIQCLLLTSSGPSEGKSLTSVNLALAYAQMGKRTLLIDTDLRRPVIHHIFNLKRDPGFSDLFVDNSKYDVIIKHGNKENLSIITAGSFTPNPAELIGSHKMDIHLEYFKANYDIIFFDTPPIVAVTDAALLGTKLDGVIIVLRSQKTSREIARHAISNLNNVGVKCLGTVLNDINLSNRYSSYGYYKYYYHYYKSKE